jgi:chaperone BCS1
MPLSASSLLRRLSTALASDLSGQSDLVELTFMLVLRNLLAKIQKCSTRLDLILRVIIPYIILFGGIYGTFSKVPTLHGIITSLWDLVIAPLSWKITGPANHSLNADVLTWFASRGLTRNAHQLALVNTQLMNMAAEETMGVFGEGDSATWSADSTAVQPLSFIPDFGKFRFRHKGYFMSIERRNDGMKDRKGNRIKCLNPHSPQNLVIECFPTLQGTAPIQDFFREVSRASNQVKPVEIETTVYRSRASHQASNDENYDMGAWVAAITRPARPIESVALETSKKNALVDDIAEFLTIECKLFYANRGLPYRRGFLLYGPPGTGKTSFCLAIAGHFNLPVYILSLSSKDMSDQQLEILFDELPSPCILLLEDVDSAGLERELTPAEQKRVARGAAKPPLTLSGLLNCLDGPTSKDGRVVCMTTNAPNSLDPALIRPGRCDQKVLFGYANEEICIKLFEHLYTKTPAELVQGETSASTQYDIPRLAREFADAVPSGGEISPAEVQGYLMVHRRDPLAAVEGARTFARDILEVKGRHMNVAEHANEVNQ